MDSPSDVSSPEDSGVLVSNGNGGVSLAMADSSDSDGGWITVVKRSPSSLRVSASSSSSSSSTAYRSDKDVLSEMESNSYSDSHPVRQPLPYDVSKAEFSDSDEMPEVIRNMPPYMIAACVSARERHVRARSFLKECIDIEEAFIRNSKQTMRKYFPFRVGAIDSETVRYINQYRKEIVQRVRFHKIIQGRMKRQYNRIQDLLKARRGSRKYYSLPPVMICELCSLANDSDARRVLNDSEVSICSNRICDKYVCMRCAFRIDQTTTFVPCPFCRSPLITFPSDSGFPISREDYRRIHGSLYPDLPLSTDQITCAVSVSTSTSIVPPALMDTHHSAGSVLNVDDLSDGPNHSNTTDNESEEV